MAVNRYTEISPSKFNPLSLQEILMVPAMKRQQHNQLLAEQQALRQGLAKVDPHDKYYDEAVRLKNELETKMDSTATKLSQQGIDNNMIADTIALNREYQNLVSPTGKLGMINAHKVNLKKTYDDYLEASVKMGNPMDVAKIHAEQALQKHLQAPLYDDKGRVIDFKIDQGPSKFIDVPARFNELAKSAGMTSDEWKRNSGYLTFDKQNNRYVVNTNRGGLTASNKAQLQSVADLMTQEIFDPSTETRRSIDYNFQDPESVLKRLNTQRGIYQTDKTGSERGYSIGSVDWSKNDTKKSNVAGITEDVNLKEINTDNAIRNVESLGNKQYKLFQLPPKQRYETEEDYQNRIKNVKFDPTTKQYIQNVGRKLTDLDIDTQNQYIDIYNSFKAKGKIDKSDKLLDYNEDTVKQIAKEMRRIQTVNFSNVIISSDSVENEILASPSLVKKDAAERDSFIQRRFKVAKGNQQQILFDKNGNEINLDDVDPSTITLNGHYSPINKLKDFGGSKNNAISPFNVSWKDKSGDLHTGLMPRDATDMNRPLFKAAKVIKLTSDKAVDNEGSFSSFNSNNLPELKNADLSIFGINTRGLSGLRTKYDSTNKTYTLELIKDGKTLGKLKPMSSEEYQNVMYDMIE